MLTVAALAARPRASRLGIMGLGTAACVIQKIPTAAENTKHDLQALYGARDAGMLRRAQLPAK